MLLKGKIKHGRTLINLIQNEMEILRPTVGRKQGKEPQGSESAIKMPKVDYIWK